MAWDLMLKRLTLQLRHLATDIDVSVSVATNINGRDLLGELELFCEVSPWNRFRRRRVSECLGHRFRQKEYGGVASLFLMVVTPSLMTVSSTLLDLAFVRRNLIRKPDPNAIILCASSARNRII